LTVRLSLGERRWFIRAFRWRWNLMQSANADDDLVLEFYCKTPTSTDNDDCPAIHRTDRGSWAVQGERREGPRVRAQLRAPKDTEGAVEIPDDLADLFARRLVKERYGVDISAEAERVDRPGPHEAEAGTAR
jgi:hypothetical protein